MIYINNITDEQTILIPRSEGVTVAPAPDASGRTGTYSRAEIDTMLSRKVDEDALKRETWEFALEDGGTERKDVAVWTEDE